MLKPYSRTDLHFRLDEEIGAEGRNSQVYRAHDPQLDANLVIKKIGKISMDADDYFRESSLLYGSAHSNVVPVLYACQDDECIYLAMPLYAQGSLKTLMAVRALTVREIVVFSTQLLSGLHHIHSKRLVHFDIKPDNVLISDRGEALLSDFGLAKPRDSNGIAGQDRLYGKMAPPESFRTEQFDHRFDIYQFGLTLYRMCLGDADYYSQYSSFIVNGVLDRLRYKHAVMNSQFPDTAASKYPEHIPERIISVVRKCLQTDPPDRYQSAIEIVNDMASVEGELLDWQYQMTGGNRSWVKLSDKCEVRLDLNDQWESQASKRSGDGAARRIKAFCGIKLNRQQVKQFLREN
ncbi:serine/threonine-protein kinase [Rhodanobacter ginsenosidimutans]|uniref:Serine/threonine-protein kinase n=1 Tax=Rhodanobacter ginsenosidimutans TaxID=490571 RepID=A0ABW0JYM9_9GAMM